MPEEREIKVKLERIRSSKVESQKMAVGSRNVGLDTSIRASNVEKAKMKVKNRSAP